MKLDAVPEGRYMILKGLYDTKVDRMKEGKYISYMFNTFGILIENVSRHVKIKGFIISGLCYEIYFPKIIDNDIQSFMKKDMKYFTSGYNMVQVKWHIKKDINSRPEFYIQLANIMKEVMKK